MSEHRPFSTKIKLENKMLLILTQVDGRPIVVNPETISAICLAEHKGKTVARISFLRGYGHNEVLVVEDAETIARTSGGGPI
jgi:hypothetical protein